jgi:hypothetical protein
MGSEWARMSMGTSGEGLLQSLGSVKLIADRPRFTRPDDPPGLLHATAYVTPPGGLLGRTGHADVRIDLPNISRLHCVFQPLGVDWTVISRSATTGVRIQAPNNEGFTLPRRFPWVLVDGLRLILGGVELIVEINRPDGAGATTTLGVHAEEVLPQDLFQTALVLTAPYRKTPAMHTFTPVREMVVALDGVSSREGVYRRLERLELWPAVAAELSNRLRLAKAGQPSTLSSRGDRYQELAAAVVVAYPGFGLGA